MQYGAAREVVEVGSVYIRATRDMLEVCAASDKMHTWLDLSTSIALQSDM